MKLIDVIEGRPSWPPPVWLMRQAGRYLPEYREVRARAGSFLDLCYAPDLAAEVTLQPIRRFGFDAAIVFADILLVPHAMGIGLRFAEGEGPVLEPPSNQSSVAGLQIEGSADRLQPVYETLARVRSELDEETALIGFCGAPWTVATYMAAGGSSADHLEARLWAYRDPDSFQALIDALVTVSADYLVRQLQAGANVVKVFDSWAGILPEVQFERWVIDPTRALVGQVREAVPGARIIGFPRGAGPLYSRYAEETGIDAVAFDQTLPLEFVRKNLQTICPVQGNIDPAALLAGGDALTDMAATTAAAMGRGPYICNLGHGIHKDTPPEHVAMLVETLRAMPAPQDHEDA